MKFKLLRGGHNEKGRNYGKGDVVESHNDLVAMFGSEKFERVSETFSSSTVQQVGEDPLKKSPAPLAKVAPVETPKEEPQEEAVIETESGSSDVPDESDMEDVTKDFPDAEALDLKVLCQSYKNRKWYFVADQDGKILSGEDKGLVKRDVMKFVEKYLEDEGK